MAVDRYGLEILSNPGAFMQKLPSGDYVKIEDYAKLLKVCKMHEQNAVQKFQMFAEAAAKGNRFKAVLTMIANENYDLDETAEGLALKALQAAIKKEQEKEHEQK